MFRGEVTLYYFWVACGAEEMVWDAASRAVAIVGQHGSVSIGGGAGSSGLRVSRQWVGYQEVRGRVRVLLGNFGVAFFLYSLVCFRSRLGQEMYG